jgi:hypothetical protein
MLTKTSTIAAHPAIALHIAAGLTGILALQPALSQDSSQTVTVDVAHCVELESLAARRECFATQVDAVLENGAEPDRLAEDIETHTSKEQPQAEAEGTEYFGTITAIRERLPNAYVITLDNGQVWQQVQPEAYPLRPGLDVRIYPTDWGNSYRLIGAGTGRHIQVRRVR